MIITIITITVTITITFINIIITFWLSFVALLLKVISLELCGRGAQTAVAVR